MSMYLWPDADLTNPSVLFFPVDAMMRDVGFAAVRSTKVCTCGRSITCLRSTAAITASVCAQNTDRTTCLAMWINVELSCSFTQPLLTCFRHALPATFLTCNHIIWEFVRNWPTNSQNASSTTNHLQKEQLIFSPMLHMYIAFHFFFWLKLLGPCIVLIPMPCWALHVHAIEISYDLSDCK